MSDNGSIDSITLLEEVYDLIGLTTLSGVFCGIAFVLYFLCARLWYIQIRRDGPQHRRYTMFSFILASVVIICSIAAMAMGTRVAQLAYVDTAIFLGARSTTRN